jgi:uncharacterized protein
MANDSPSVIYMKKMLYKILVTLLLIGGFNWLSVGILQVDIVKRIFGRRLLGRSIYVAVGLTALWLAFQRDFYLPFLGETVLPAGALTNKTPTNANQAYTIKVEPRAKVIYWATEPTDDKEVVNDWSAAYQNYENSGVTQADDAGNAVIRLRGPPQSYTVPWKGTLEPHFHFRESTYPGFFGPIHTYFIKSGVIEPFQA